jgi:hypothetical protein
LPGRPPVLGELDLPGGRWGCYLGGPIGDFVKPLG